MLLALVIPVYNEKHLFLQAIARIDETPPPPGIMRVLCIVDDGSTDGTAAQVQQLSTRADVRTVIHNTNRGKGAALRTGFTMALETGADLILVQDADLEYDPADHAAVLAPLIDGKADAVIGSRFLGQTHRVLYYWHSIANRVITTFSNMCTNLNLTDIECGTKAFSKDILSKIAIDESDFAVEPELIAKLSRLRVRDESLKDTPSQGWRRLRIYEVPVSYWGRTYDEGKKIRPKDGIKALAAIVKHNLL
jgi:glycosyltransferase involved in cell wall biosynthesis